MKEQQFEKALAASLEISFQTTVAAEEPGRGGRGRGAQSSTDAVFLAARAGRGGGPTFTIAIPQQSFGVEARIYDEGPENVAVASVEVIPSDGKNWNARPVGPANSDVKAGTLAQWRFDVTVPRDAAITRPYFTRPDEEQPYYDLIDARYRNLPTAPYPLAARARLSYHGVPFQVAQDVQTSERVPGIGMIENPLIVAPAISVSVSPTAGAVPLESKSFAFTCTVHSNVKGPAQGTLHLKLPAGWRSAPPDAPFAFSRDGEDQTLRFSVTPDTVKPVAYTITAVAEYKGKSYAEGYHLAGYPGVRPYPFYRPATYKAVGIDVKSAPGLHVGFLPGTGDDVPKALENLGMNVRILATSDLTHGDLSVYDTIILGTRAYAVRQDLKSANARLMDYVKNGGVLIVQYNLQDFDHDYGPYPFTLGCEPAKSSGRKFPRRAP